MPSVFDAPAPVMKGNGQPGVNQYAPPPAPPPNAPTSSPGIANGIQALVASLAQAFAPKAITQRKAKVASDIAEATGDQSALGNQF